MTVGLDVESQQTKGWIFVEELLLYSVIKDKNVLLITAQIGIKSIISYKFCNALQNHS